MAAGEEGASLILAEKIGPVQVFTLNRPERRNAFDKRMAERLSELLDRFEADRDSWVAILRANGPAFCAGLDLRAAQAGEIAATQARGSLGILQKPPSKPLIAAVDGAAIGGGMEITLCCDLVVASQSSTFGLAEVTRGLVAAGGGCFRLPRRIPRQIAMEMMLTGKPVSAEAMLRCGYVNRVVESSLVAQTAMELAQAIAANSPLAVQASKLIAQTSMDDGWTDSAAWKLQHAFLDPVLQSRDLQEGLQAFAEKRAAVWVGA